MEEKQLATATLTPAIAKTKMNLALTAQNMVLQTLQTKADEVEKNEDHLEEMKAVIDLIKKAKKVIEDKHAEIKKPYLESSRACDVSKNELFSLYDAVQVPLVKKYSELCAVVQKRKDDEAAKEKKKRDILQLIETTVVDFSAKIAACNTRKALIDVERMINLEKGGQRAFKYEEFLPFAVTRFNEVLIPAITEQKKVVEQLETVSGQVKKAQEAGDVEKLEELQEQQESIQSVLNTNQLKVQEHAIFNEMTVPDEVTVIHPTVPKGGRTDYEMEIVDIAVAFKKSFNLLKIDLKLADAKEIARMLDDAGSFKTTDSVTTNGIKYTKKMKY